ncbi:excalibur calcium-binding domain-containing protein [Fictibacillus enclensis]|uniref:Excalibur calcium-binding domain-containing protein n=1 Tax=Fictibacillus solisalsi TaxID=459525 RepID=A0A1G9ZU23_9BACL|nr:MULTISPECIES: excalibur calcium-binding domain-containing protein [Fictibacillus]MDM5197210.1 excalibur calcium-binding domain-containing protein [Fictibacillus enclensis]SDN24627.1 Excalibur calcium-binding domain-containing protein [Fictibacillus solisalsi]
MKKVSAVLLTCGLVVSLSSGLSAEAKTSVAKVKTYKNCTEMHKDYKGGVSRAKNVKNKGGKTKYKPHVSKALYDANKKSDRDKDLIACEQ